MKVYVINPEDAPKHTVLKIKDKEKGGPVGQRYCWYQCTVKGGREGKDIDAVSLAKVCVVTCTQLGIVDVAVATVGAAGEGLRAAVVGTLKEIATSRRWRCIRSFVSVPRLHLV